MNESVPRSIVVPGYTGRAARVPAGALLTITDLEGCQIGDLFVLAAADPTEVLSPAVTRLVNFTPFPRRGECFYSNRRRALLTLVEDASPGPHDMTFAPCDREIYRDLGAGDDHPNCRDNFHRAIAELGLHPASAPDPINVFQNTPIAADGSYTIGVTRTRPGDWLRLRSECDLVIVLTACAVDIPFAGVQPNGGRSTPLRLDIG
ncbi:MAG: urea carboxylase-associated family protein [Gammaproteobacteria bacterium]|nr:urea carboxylase-associated family protein [Gammaproteobacteria bacterium]